MKLFNTITASLLLCAGLVSCEMKDELRGSGEGSSEVGYLNLGVAVNASQNNVVSRAEVTDDNVNVGTSVSADDFPVVITGVTDPEYSKEYASYADLRDENDGVVELPVGEYTVTAHSNATLLPQMSAPYYEGTAPIKITAGVESSTNVECTMKNMKFQLTYTSNFLLMFKEWDITVNDGTGNVLRFDETDKNPAAVYWLVGENVSKIKVEITATPTDGGQQVHEWRDLTKPAGGNSAYWTGADALTVQMEESTPTDPTGIQGSGIKINASVTFTEEEEEVTVPVTPGDDDPITPPTPPEDPKLPTVTFPQNTYTLPADASKNADAVIASTAGGGIQSVVVQILAGNDDFSDITSVMGFVQGVELVGDPTGLSNTIGSIVQGLEMPQAGATSYTFPVGGFFDILQQMGVTTAEEGHVFNITVKDANGETSASLSVKVTE